jgi:hypothetical protein
VGTDEKRETDRPPASVGFFETELVVMRYPWKSLEDSPFANDV